MVKKSAKKKRVVKKKIATHKTEPTAAAKKKVITKTTVIAPAKYPVRMHRVVYRKYLTRPNISNTVKNALLLGASTIQCLSMVKRWFPKSTLSASNVSQFRTTLRKEGYTPVEKETSIKAIIGKKPSK